MRPEELAEGLRAGDRRALAKAITLVESQLAQDRLVARRLMKQLGQTKPGLRLGVTGAPGVGKSTFIDKLGAASIRAGWRPAVLAFDPTGRAGGSILGDKTRMQELSQSEHAFVRPSPNKGASGGIGYATLATLSLCEAAGYDPVIIETVGVGQSELAVSEVADLLLVLLEPAAGDELQGIKKGLLEYADLVLINKADGPRRESAAGTASDYERALSLLSKDSEARVRTVSSIEGDGPGEVWELLRQRFTKLSESRRLTDIRAGKLKAAFRRCFTIELERSVLSQPRVLERRQQLEEQVMKLEIPIDDAIEELLRVTAEARAIDRAPASSPGSGSL